MSRPNRAGPRRTTTVLRVVAGFGCLLGALALGPGQVPAGGEDAPVDACANIDQTVDLIGSSSAREALIGWGAAVCSEAGVIADYTDFGSYGGREAVLPADAEVIGLTSLPFDEAEQAQLKANKRGIVLVPFLTSAVACTYWDTNPFNQANAGKRFPELRISRRTLADLSGGSPRDGTNASADLKADNAGNPGYDAGPPYVNVEVWFRSGASAVAERLTDWFHQDPQAEKDFTKGSLEGYALPFEDIGTPDGSAPSLINDYATMKSRMLGALQNLGIGCMDNASARTDAKPETEAVEALNIARLDNNAGSFVLPTDEAVTIAAKAMTAKPDGTFAVDWKLEDPKAYPMPLLVYAAMPTCGISAAARTSMDKVMTYAIGKGQQKLPAGNVPMPDNVAAVASKQLASWRSLTEKAGPCTPIEATTTTTSPTATTVPPTTAPDGEGTYVPPAGSGGDGAGGGVYTDPSLATSGGGGGGTGPEASAPGAGGTGGTAPVAAVEEAGPVTPIRKVVAIATGSAAVPPGALLAVGGVLLVAGPVLQVFGGLRRPGSFPATFASWFSRLKP